MSGTFTIEYAKSNRSGCKACKQNIGKDTLRIGKMSPPRHSAPIACVVVSASSACADCAAVRMRPVVSAPSPHFDGEVPLWNHWSCFAKSKMRIADVSLVTGFDNIRPDDQDRITNFIDGHTAVAKPAGSSSTPAPASTSTASGAAEGEEGSYMIEYAKSGRSTCQVCSAKIDKDSVRVGRMERAAQFDGITPRWAHLACTQQRERIDDAGLLHGLDNLRPEDQEDARAVVEGRPIKERMDEDGAEDEQGGKKASKAKKGGKKKGKRSRDEDEEEDEEDEGAKKKRGKTSKAARGGKSGAAAAADEEEKEADEAVDYSSMTAAQLKEECKAHELPATGAKAKLIERLSEWQSQQKPAKKTSTAATSSHSSSSSSTQPPPSTSPVKAVDPQEAEYDRQLKEEGTLRWSIRDPLKKNLSSSQVKHLTEQLGLSTYGGPDRLLDTLTDVMMYGMPAPCPECGHNAVYYKDGRYRCGGIASEWAKCGWTADDVERSEFEVPDGWEELPPFDTYIWRAREKPLEAHRHKAEAAAAKQQAFGKAREEIEARREEKRQREEREADEANVLCSLRILLHGKAFSTPLAELKAAIQDKGGVLARTVKDADIVLCVASVVEEGKGKVLKDANALQKAIVKEEWLLDSLQQKDMQPLKAYLLSEDASVLNEATKLLETAKQAKQQQKSGANGSGGSKSGFGKSGKSGKLRLQKGARAAVDPDSGLDESGHILEQSADEVYAVAMSIADVQTGHNSFYILQLIESDSGGGYHVFRKWGRLGTEQGHSKITEYNTKAQAVKEFSAVYLDKVTSTLPLHTRAVPICRSPALISPTMRALRRPATRGATAKSLSRGSASSAWWSRTTRRTPSCRASTSRTRTAPTRPSCTRPCSPSCACCSTFGRCSACCWRWTSTWTRCRWASSAARTSRRVTTA